MNPHPDTEGGAAVSAPEAHEDDTRLDPTPETDEHEPIGASLVPDSAFEALRRQYAEADGERTKTMLLLPGRWNGGLAVRFHTIPFDESRRQARKMVKGGETTESELNFVASIIAEACTEVMMRPKAGADLESMGELMGRGEPVRFDSTLCEALGIPVDASRLTSKAIVRLVFKNPEAMTAFYAELASWLREESAEDEDDAERPT